MAWRATHGAQVPEGIEYPPFPATYTDQHLESAQYLNELEEEMDELLWAHSFSKIEKGGRDPVRVSDNTHETMPVADTTQEEIPVPTREEQDAIFNRLLESKGYVEPNPYLPLGTLTDHSPSGPEPYSESGPSNSSSFSSLSPEEIRGPIDPLGLSPYLLESMDIFRINMNISSILDLPSSLLIPLFLPCLFIVVFLLFFRIWYDYYYNRVFLSYYINVFIKTFPFCCKLFIFLIR